mmetsp:Transcript_5912/g.6780  ORF Transcript_5912/g.6780 Transcript_5912/m.6780 type:complete len:251 (+) Transcript_5912:11-763(+)
MCSNISYILIRSFLKSLIPNDENSSSSTNIRKNSRKSKRSKPSKQDSNSSEGEIGLQACLWTFQWICSQDKEARVRILNQEEELEDLLNTLALISELDSVNDKSVVLETLFKISIHRDIHRYQEKFQLEEDFEDPTSLKAQHIIFPEKLKSVLQHYTAFFNSQSKDDKAKGNDVKSKTKKRNIASNQEEWEGIACVSVAAISDCLALNTKTLTADDDKSISAFVDSVRKLNINGSADVMFEKRVMPKIKA